MFTHPGRCGDHRHCGERGVSSSRRQKEPRNVPGDSITNGEDATRLLDIGASGRARNTGLEDGGDLRGGCEVHRAGKRSIQGQTRQQRRTRLGGSVETRAGSDSRDLALGWRGKSVNSCSVGVDSRLKKGDSRRVPWWRGKRHSGACWRETFKRREEGEGTETGRRPFKVGLVRESWGSVATLG